MSKMICNFLKEVKLSGLFFVCLVLQRSRVAADVPPTGFANLRVINAGVCKINAFGVGLNAEVPLMQVWKSIKYVGVKIFLEFCCECNISDCSYLFIFPLSVFSFQSRFSALTGRSSARSLDRLFVSSFFSRSSIVNSFVRLFVRSFVRSFVVLPSLINREFVRSSVRSFVCSSFVNREFVRPSVCSFVRSFGPSPVYLVSQSVCLSATQSVSRPDS